MNSFAIMSESYGSRVHLQFQSKINNKMSGVMNRCNLRFLLEKINLNHNIADHLLCSRALETEWLNIDILKHDNNLSQFMNLFKKSFHSMTHLINRKSCPLTLEQRKSDASLWNLRTSFDCKNKMLTWKHVRNLSIDLLKARLKINHLGQCKHRCTCLRA